MASKVVRIVFTLAAIFLAAYVLYASRTIILYLIISTIFALIGRPLYNLLMRARIGKRIMPSGLAAMITLFSLIGLIALLLGYFIPAIISEGQIIASLDSDQIESTLAPLFQWANEIGRSLSLDNDFAYGDGQLTTFIADNFDVGIVTVLLNSFLGVLGNFLIAFFSVAFITFFLLSDPAMISRLLHLVTPLRLEPSADRIIVNTRRTMSRYFIGLLVQVIAVSICIYIGLSILGVKNALLIAVFSGLANLIPYLGPWIGATFALFVITANAVEVNFQINMGGTLIGLVIVYFVTQMIDNYLLQPTIFSNSVDAHPLEIFIVILVAGTIGGIGAMIAAVPAYAFLRIIFKEMDREFGWMAAVKAK